MPEKIGRDFVRDMIDRGRREIGGLWPDGNVPQPMYPLRGGYANMKEPESPAVEEPNSSVVDDRLAQVDQDRDDRGQDRDMERE